jgi:hypothetical protein
MNYIAGGTNGMIFEALIKVFHNWFNGMHFWLLRQDRKFLNTEGKQGI